MAARRSKCFITEPARDCPILYDVDVVVAGSGLSGTFAAIAAGRCGAKTLVVERFGSLGGNIGPGMILGGGLYKEAEITLPGGLSGIPKEFMQRLDALKPAQMDRFPEEASICSYLARQMMREAGVEILLSAYVSDPIMEGDTVRGVFVECVSGRFAIKAKVTVDGTGVADVARRAGAPMVPFLHYHESLAPYIRAPYLKKEYPTYWNDTKLLIVIAGVDVPKFKAAWEKKEADIPEADRLWAEQNGEGKVYPAWLLPALHKAWEAGRFRTWREIEPNVRCSSGTKFTELGDGVLLGYVTCVGAVDAGNPKQVSKIEEELRAAAFELVQFYRENVPGFETAYLVTCNPFFGWRGGPHIDGRHTLSPKDAFAGRKFDDVLYRNVHEHDHGGEASGFDVPYRIALPKHVEGLLVCGRGAAYLRRGHDPSGMRARPSMMVFGQCVGTAAAIAALDGVLPSQVDIKKVQKRLIQDGIFLGEQERLKELGLA